MKPRERYHPEVRVGGYSAVDGTVEFYTRMRTLLAPDQVILDLGAGRGGWVEDLSMAPLTRELLDLRGDGRRLVGCDVDPAVRLNPLLDAAHVLPTSASPFPFDDGSFDLVVSDWTFEHLSDPAATAEEVARVLKTGGWLCARTPNKNGYISLANRVIPEKLHGWFLQLAQPLRKSEDAFPTFYRANTPNRIRRYFGEAFDVLTYTTNSEPAYFRNSRIMWVAFKTLERLLPRRMGAVLLIFAQRR